MKSRLLLTVVLLSAGVTAQSAHDTANRNPLLGAWNLLSLEEPTANGQLHKADCSGLFVFTRDGKAAVQVMYRNGQTGSVYAQGGYEASYGSYHIDDANTFSFHIDGALVRTLVGTDNLQIVSANEEVRG